MSEIKFPNRNFSLLHLADLAYTITLSMQLQFAVAGHKYLSWSSTMAKAAAKATKTATKEKVAREYDPNKLSENEQKVMTVLAKTKNPLTRGELSAKTGIAKGWSALLGTPTKGADEGSRGDRSLEARGFVKSHMPEEGTRGYTYSLTPAGRKVLDKQDK